MPSGKYFFLRNKSNNLYLDANGLKAQISPGKTVVSLWNKQECKANPTKSSQVWYWDSLTSTLRCSLFNLCLDINDENRVVINFLDLKGSVDHKHNLTTRSSLTTSKSLLSKYSPIRRRSSAKALPDEPVTLLFTQQWKINKQRNTIENVVDEEKVLEVVDKSSEVGAEVCVNHLSFKAAQMWQMEPIPPQYMFIISKSNEGHVMDLLGGKISPGATVGLYVKKRSDSGFNSQLWFEDELGNLRTKLNDKLVLSATATSLKTENAENTTQRWVICGNRIVSAIDHRYVLGIGRKRNSFSIDDNDVFYLCSSLYQALDSQHWSFVTV